MRRDASQGSKGAEALIRPGTSGSLREYRGDGFSIEIPPTWVDRTIHAFAGPPDRGFVPGLWITVDPEPGSSDLSTYADGRVQTILHTMSGSRLSLRKQVTLPAGHSAVRAEIRWYPTDEQRLYQRLLCLLEEGKGFNLSAQMNKRARQTRGPAINRIMESIRIVRNDTGGGPKDRNQYRADQFCLVLEEGWVSETVHALMEPGEGRFRRTLLIRRDPVADPDMPDDQVVEAELELLSSSVPGFELLERQPMQLRGGDAALHLRYRRQTPKESQVLQDQVLAVGSGRILSLTLTTEQILSEPERAQLDACLRSFAPVGGRSTESGGAGAGQAG